MLLFKKFNMFSMIIFTVIATLHILMIILIIWFASVNYLHIFLLYLVHGFDETSLKCETNGKIISEPYVQTLLHVRFVAHN